MPQSWPGFDAQSVQSSGARYSSFFLLFRVLVVLLHVHHRALLLVSLGNLATGSPSSGLRLYCFRLVSQITADI